MKSPRCPREIVRLNGAAFRLSPVEIFSIDVETLVEIALSQVRGGNPLDPGCVQYGCSMYAPRPT